MWVCVSWVGCEMVFDVVDINIVVGCTGCERRVFFLGTKKGRGDFFNGCSKRGEPPKKQPFNPQKFVWIEPLCTALNSQ
jgi:hypothetical protein